MVAASPPLPDNATTNVPLWPSPPKRPQSLGREPLAAGGAPIGGYAKPICSLLRQNVGKSRRLAGSATGTNSWSAGTRKAVSNHSGKEFATRLDDIHIETLEALEQAAHDGRLEQLEGFGPQRARGD